MIRMCKLPVGEEPHLWPALQTEWVEKAVSCLHLATRYKLPFKLLRRSDGRWRWPVGDRAAVFFFFFSV